MKKAARAIQFATGWKYCTALDKLRAAVGHPGADGLSIEDATAKIIDEANMAAREW